MFMVVSFAAITLVAGLAPPDFESLMFTVANIAEQPVIKFEKLPVLVPPFPPQCGSGQPRERDFPEPSQVRKRW
jgi:hypothetical protein